MDSVEMKEDEVVGETKKYLEMATKTFPHSKIEKCKLQIKFNIKGQTAGQVQYKKNNEFIIRYNPTLLVNGEYKDFLEETVPHEVAHVITHIVYGKVKPHGSEWKRIMRSFGKNPQTYHNYNLKKSRNVKKFRYKCKCKHHFVGLKVHKKIHLGYSYSCKKCKNDLIYDPE